MWVLLGGMFPNQIRGAALAVAGLSQWLTNFVVTMSFPVLLTSIGLGGAYALYAGFAVVSLFVVRALVVAMGRAGEGSNTQQDLVQLLLRS
jgi:SP family sugar:H+ symporter-like MFS transporter